MAEDSRAMDHILNAPNPFSLTLDSFIDVPLINNKAFEDILTFVRSTQVDGKSRIALLLGEVGLGRTHLLARLRSVADLKKFYFISIDPVHDIEKILIHIFRQVINNLRKTPSDSPHTYLERIIGDRVTDRIYLDFQDKPGFESVVVKLKANPAAVFGLRMTDDAREDLYSKVINEISSLNPEVNVRFLHTLFKITDERYSSLVLKWLQGELLTVEERREISVRNNLETEDDASDALKSLLAISDRILVLGFDQVEAIGTRFGDERLRDFLQILTDMPDKYKKLVSLLSFQSQVWRGRISKDLDVSITEKIVTEIELGGISPDAAQELVKARMARIWENTETFPPSNLFPFNGIIINRVATDKGWNPRNFLNGLSNIFEKIQTNRSVERGILEGSKIPEPLTEENIQQAYFGKLQALEENYSFQFDSMTLKEQEENIKIAIYDILQILSKNGNNYINQVNINYSPLRSRTLIDLFILGENETRRVRLGAIVTFSKNMRSLQDSLNALAESREAQIIDRIIVFRGKYAIDDSSTHKILTDLLSTGELVFIDDKTANGLYTVRRFLDNLSTGDVLIEGRQVSFEEASIYLARWVNQRFPLIQRILSQITTFLGVIEPVQDIKKISKPLDSEETKLLALLDQTRADLSDKTVGKLKELRYQKDESESQD